MSFGGWVLNRIQEELDNRARFQKNVPTDVFKEFCNGLGGRVFIEHYT